MTMIDPSGIPGADLDPESVRTGAFGIGRDGGVVRDQGAEIVRDWQRMPGVFEATGTESLYTAMTPVGTTTTAIGDSLDGIARALTAYASEVEPIKARLDALRSQAASFVTKANAFQSHTEWVSSGYTLWIPRPERIDSWDQDPGLTDENNSLIRQVAQAEADWLDAQQRCATAIRAAVGLGATGAADERALAEQLRSGDQLQTPWGTTGDRKESCSEKASTFPAHFLWDGVVVGFAWGTIKSLDTLSGLNPDAVWKAGDGILHGDWGQVVEAGKEDLAATGQAWLGLTHLVSSIAIPVNPALRMQLLQSGAFDRLPPEVRQGAEDWTAADGTALYGTVAGFVGLTLPTKWWDPKAYKADQVFKNWTENPGGAAGTSVANIASFFIPGAGEAKAAGVAGDAAKVAEGTRVADVLADGSAGTLRGLSADALKATIKGLSDADAAKLATELAKPELDAGALSGLKLDDLTIHEPTAMDDAPALPREPAPEGPAVREPAVAGDPAAVVREPAPVVHEPAPVVHEPVSAPAAATHGSGAADTARANEVARVQADAAATSDGPLHDAAARAEQGPSVHEGSADQVPAHETPVHDTPPHEPATQDPATQDHGTHDPAAGLRDGGAVQDAPVSVDTHPRATEPVDHASADEGPGHKYSAAIFGPSNKPYYEVPSPTLGRAGRPFFVMPADDAAAIHDAGSAARYTGMSPSTLDAYVAGQDVYAVVFPTDGIPHAVPTAADAMGWPHFLEGGHTAVLLEGPKAGYLVNPTHEFVIAGGTPVPAGSVLVRIGERSWEILHRW